MVKTFMGTAEILIKTSVDSGAGRWGIALRNGLGQLNLRENFSGAWYASGGAESFPRPARPEGRNVLRPKLTPAAA